ncbi:unnamed protein product [Cuscuta epithymum]|uniref:Uncharacterized protein n=1 Tax=Cuscuta epithymum TaxID=186058 RepID=A0AAV0C4U2_9ASTE|nr:unnamed protein product [Cuscuta epithymum]
MRITYHELHIIVLNFFPTGHLILATLQELESLSLVDLQGTGVQQATFPLLTITASNMPRPTPQNQHMETIPRKIPPLIPQTQLRDIHQKQWISSEMFYAWRRLCFNVISKMCGTEKALCNIGVVVMVQASVE